MKKCIAILFTLLLAMSLVTVGFASQDFKSDVVLIVGGGSEPVNPDDGQDHDKDHDKICDCGSGEDCCHPDESGKCLCSEQGECSCEPGGNHDDDNHDDDHDRICNCGTGENCCYPDENGKCACSAGGVCKCESGKEPDDGKDHDEICNCGTGENCCHPDENGKCACSAGGVCKCESEPVNPDDGKDHDKDHDKICDCGSGEDCCHPDESGRCDCSEGGECKCESGKTPDDDANKHDKICNCGSGDSCCHPDKNGICSCSEGGKCKCKSKPVISIPGDDSGKPKTCQCRPGRPCNCKPDKYGFCDCGTKCHCNTKWHWVDKNPGKPSKPSSNPNTKPSKPSQTQNPNANKRRGDKSGGYDIANDPYYLIEGVHVNKTFREEGYMYGFKKFVFGPNEYLTRAQFAAIMDRVFEFDNQKVSKSFDDTRGHWAEAHINRLASNGIILGVSDTEFRPNDALTRGHVLLMLTRVLDTAEYSKVANWDSVKAYHASETVSKLLNSGIYDNLNSNYDINARITRGEMVHLMNNIIYARNAMDSVTENYIRTYGIYMDLLNNPSYQYYDDCIKALNDPFVIAEVAKYA